jgi:hypothetical protein
MDPNEPARVYVETSVWNFAFADDAPEHQKATLQFFEQVRQGRFKIYVSNVVLLEINNAPEPQRSRLQGLLDELSPVGLYTSPEADHLAAHYISKGMVSEKHADDARHIAIAVVEGIDMLVSWNFKHIVKPKTRRMVGDASRKIGYYEVQICTPEEVIANDELG